MIVVFDTNIWKSSLYLRAGAASAVRFYLHQKGAKVGMPEVVRLEVERHLRTDIKETREQVRESHQRLLGMVGKLQDVMLPGDEDIEAVVVAHIGKLGFDLVEVPFTLESARSSLLRTIDKVPPSHGSQQFKDGVIWADCLQLARDDDVTLVTSDKAFYEDGDLKKGKLAKSLLDETRSLQHQLRVVPSLAALLAEIKGPVNVSDQILVEAINEQLGADIGGVLERLAFVRAGSPVVTKSFYATEKPNSLFVEFRLEVPCEDASGAGRFEAMLTAAGDGQYDARSKTFVGLSPTDISITYKTADGTEESRRSVYARLPPLTIGTPTIQHSVRKRLDD